MSKNYDVVVIFPLYDQFGAIQKSDSGRMVYETYISINSNLLSYKNEKQNQKTKISLTQLSNYCFV